MGEDERPGRGAGTIASEGNLAIRRIRDDAADFELMARWLNEAHVREMWHDRERVSIDDVIAKYRPRTDASSPTTSCFIEIDARAVGYIQFYRWSDYAAEAAAITAPNDHRSWGLDVFVGERDLVGTGVGSRAIGLLLRHLFEERSATTVALVTQVTNAGAIRAYERCGFRKVRVVKDAQPLRGEYPDHWLMVADRPLLST